jgi:BioD-like phosphotransacetylase family protein
MMAKSIYVTSTQTFSGKSALCVGMLRRFQQDGFKIGYMKPVCPAACQIVGDRIVDEDTHFVKNTFSLTEAYEDMSPVLLNDQEVMSVLSGEEHDYVERVKSAFETVSKSKDVVVLEGGGSLREGWIVNLAPPQVSDLLDAREIVVVSYENDLQVVDDLITARVRLGDSLLGGVINRVPGRRLDFVREQVKPFVEKNGVPVLAVLPKEKILLSTSVSELREGLGGEILCGHQGLEELVENVMIGAMNVDSAFTYFRRKPNKVVITGGDRPDIQMAALETSTKCIVVTGNLRPSPMIIGRAEELGVPIIMTYHDTFTVVEMIEGFFGKTPFHQQSKIERYDQLLDQNMDFDALYKAIGLR